ncbi:uncharacterized protein trdc, partial [Pagrus major]|uniref:uncharacterized protein trdc n=1 Tax=Pagrus major TaxID=143350 RepID=UPI003CC8589C
FGKAIRLTVEPKDPSPVEPTLFVLSPLHPEGVPLTELADEVCLATNFRPKGDDLVINVRNKRQINTSTSDAVISQTEKTYFYAGFTNETIFSCEINGTSSNNDNVDLCADLHPEKAKLNLYLLLMNGVRVVFTKVLAFSTIFTIRAVLR